MLVRLALLLVWSLRRLLLLLPHGRLLLLPHGLLLLLPHGRLLLLLPHGGLLLLPRGCCPGDGSCEWWLGLGLGLGLRLLELEMNSGSPISPLATGSLYLILAIMPRATQHKH